MLSRNLYNGYSLFFDDDKEVAMFRFRFLTFGVLFCVVLLSACGAAPPAGNPAPTALDSTAADKVAVAADTDWDEAAFYLKR